MRFYAWSLFLFVKQDLTGSMNRVKEPEEMFAGFVSFFQERFAEMTTNSERIALLEEFLLRKLMMLGKQVHPDF